jgi:hypothetical protein
LWAVQIIAHSARTFSTLRNKNCRKPLACLICPNTGSTIEAAIGDFLSHRLRQRPAGLAVPGRGAFGATRSDVAVDAPEFETREIGLAQGAAIG